MHALAGASSVDSVVRVTGNFASEGPLHPAAREALLAAFDQGWADPKKLSQSSSKAAILRNHALENISTRLAIAVDSIEVLGEPSLGHFLSIAGLFHDSSPFAYSTIDKGKIRAIARSHQSEVTELTVDASGAIQGLSQLTDGCVLSLQLANGETTQNDDFARHETLRLRPTNCPITTMARARKNIDEPMTFACAGIPRAAAV